MDSFVKESLPDISNVEHLHKQGQAPQLRLFDHDENEVDVVRYVFVFSVNL